MPNPTEIMIVPNDFSQIGSQTDGFTMMTLQGVGCEFIVKYEENGPEGSRIISMIFPDSGPVTALKKWMRTPHKALVWDVPTFDFSTPEKRDASYRAQYNVQSAAAQYVLDMMHAELRAELGI